MTTPSSPTSPVPNASSSAEPGSVAPPAGRVVLIDSRPDRMAIMSHVVERCPLLTVVGSAGTFEEAEALIVAEVANVAFLEIQMPVAMGLTTIGSLRTRFPDLRIVVCSFHDDQGTREEAKACGADFYLTKPPTIRDLLEVVPGISLAAR